MYQIKLKFFIVIRVFSFLCSDVFRISFQCDIQLLIIIVCELILILSGKKVLVILRFWNLVIS